MSTKRYHQRRNTHVGKRKRAREDTQRQLQRITGLREINLAITSSLDLHTILRILLEKIDLLLPYSAATTVRLFNRDTGKLEFLACRNIPEEEWRAYTQKGGYGLSNAVFENRAPVMVTRLQTDPRTPDPEFFRRHGLVSYLGVPLVAKGEALGVLSFHTKEEHEFSEEEIQLLSTLASQAAIAIYNSQLYDEAKNQAVKNAMLVDRVRQNTAQLELANQQLSALYSISTVINQSIDIDIVLRSAMRRILQVFNFEAGRIYLMDQSANEIRLVAHEGFPEAILPQISSYKSGEGIMGRLFEDGKPMFFQDIQNDPEFHRLASKRLMLNAGYRAQFHIPIWAKGRTIGMMNFASRNPHEFLPSEVDLVHSIANHVGIAIENANLFSDLKEKTVELEKANKDLERKQEIQKLLKELSQDITSLDLDSLLKKLTQKVREVFKVDISDVRLIEKEGRRIVGVSGIDVDRLREGSTGKGRGGSGWIAANRRPLVISDISRGKDLPMGQTTHRIGVRGYLGLPIISRAGEVIGILRALTYQPRDFAQEEIDLLQQLANGAAIALENARLLEQTKKQAVELEKANKAQADFAAMIAHDLRAPLTAVISGAAMLEDGLFGPVNEEQKKWLAKIQGNSRNVVDLVNNFLDLSKLEAGHVDLVIEEVDLQQLIQNSLDNYRIPAQEKNIALQSCVDSGLPRIRGDPRRLDQVFANLLSNAIKFTKEGGEIEVGACPDGATQAKMWVEDDGVGIPLQEMGNLFEKYCQTTSGRTSRQKGTGLGLVICKMIVEAHGGKIWAESEEGKGTTVAFTIPVDG